MLQSMDDGARIVAALLASGLSTILLAQFDLTFSIWLILLIYLAAVVFVTRAVESIRTDAALQGRAEERAFYREHDLLKPRRDPAWAALREGDNFNEVTEKLLRAFGDGRGLTG
jgi:hypothetical protein